MSNSQYTDRRNIWAGGNPDIDWSDYLDTDQQEVEHQQKIRETIRAVKRDLKE